MSKFSLVTTQPPLRGSTKKQFWMPRYELETRPFIKLLNQLRNIARVTSYVNTELFTTIFASWPPQTPIQRVSFTARQHCRALASSVALQQRCRQHYRGQYSDNKTSVLDREAGLNNGMSSQNSNIQGCSSTYVNTSLYNRTVRCYDSGPVRYSSAYWSCYSRGNFESWPGAQKLRAHSAWAYLVSTSAQASVMSQTQHEDGVCKKCIPLNEASVFQHFGKACAEKSTRKYF
jgi:hypothetical protein